MSAGRRHQDSPIAAEATSDLSVDSPFTTINPSMSSAVPASSNTKARSINDISIQSVKIDECFALFFKHYHPILPIFNPSPRPDSYYRLSPFIFWCIVITGSRRYDTDPTVLERLIPGVNRLALEALLHVKGYFPTICGLLVLCVWPLPMQTAAEDPSPMYCGATMQLALQHRLHLFTQKQTSIQPTSIMSIVQDANIARVWSYLEFVCHCTSWTIGSPPHLLSDAFDLASYDGSLARTVPSSIYWMQRFEKLSTRLTITLTELVCATNDGVKCQSDLVLNGLIQVFDEQILEMSRKALKEMQPERTSSGDRAASAGSRAQMYPNPLIVGMSRIHLNAYHFFGTDICLHLSYLIELHQLACQWTQQACKMDNDNDWALYSSESYFRHMVLVAVVILRISHSQELKVKVDVAKGELAYFTIVKLLKRRSLQIGDVNAQTAASLSALWNDDYCFRLPDGTQNSLNVRTRGQGVMDIVYDCIPPAGRKVNQFRQYQVQEHEHQDLRDEIPSAMQSVPSSVVDHIIPEVPVPYIAEDYFPPLEGDISAFNFLQSSFSWPQDNSFWA
ncbi:hypothetical protein LTR84_008362 [Exophiala bonariae]|uniref:Transcription factor domain-containing protein n=1 Tax=Exophiala bonariae TaxID=1690606 RepID=A0AAV9MX94_9EURO|nr:hypothetical protein LTR84_008362 [Exophiala bonariae]